MVRMCKSNVSFSCVRPSVCRSSICPSSYLLLNHSAEFNQICYITSPHSKGVKEQHCFSVCPSMRPTSIHLFVKLVPPKLPGGIQPELRHELPSWLGCARATLFFERPFICPSRYLLPSRLLIYFISFK